MSKSNNKSSPMPIVALLLAWLLPGAGHIYIGRKIRGLVIMITIAATFWTGVAIGGVMTVDYYNARWWFIADMVTGVHGIVGWHRQKQVYKDISRDHFGVEGDLAGKLPPPLLDKMLKEKGIALNDSPTDNIARSYAGVAGMLNLLCIIDALMLSLMGVKGEPLPAPQSDQEKKS